MGHLSYFQFGLVSWKLTKMKKVKAQTIVYVITTLFTDGPRYEGLQDLQTTKIH